MKDSVKDGCERLQPSFLCPECPFWLVVSTSAILYRYILRYFRSKGDKMDANDTELRFWSKVQKGSACWRWTGTVHKAGYGVWRDGKTLFYAHRYAYLLLAGDIRAGECLYNTCSDRLCVNPKHWTTDKPIQQTVVRYNKPKKGRRGNFKLSDAEVQAIISISNNTNLTQTAVAKRYRISQAQVSRILAGRSR